MIFKASPNACSQTLCRPDCDGLLLFDLLLVSSLRQQSAWVWSSSSSSCPHFQDDSTLCSGTRDEPMSVVPAASPSPSVRTIGCTAGSSQTQSYTESALRELYQHVTSMPESAKKKKLIRQVLRVRLSLRAQGEESSHASRSVLFLVWEADVTEPLDWAPDPVQQEALALTLLRGNYQGLCCFLI